VDPTQDGAGVVAEVTNQTEDGSHYNDSRRNLPQNEAE
jgi:hypothetical protein